MRWSCVPVQRRGGPAPHENGTRWKQNALSSGEHLLFRVGESPRPDPTLLLAFVNRAIFARGIGRASPGWQQGENRPVTGGRRSFLVAKLTRRQFLEATAATAALAALRFPKKAEAA